MKVEAPLRLIETSYSRHYLEIPTEGWSLVRRWEWIKAIITGGDIVYRTGAIQHLDLRTPQIKANDEKEKGGL